MTTEEHKWIETNNSVCALLKQAHDVLAMSSFPPKRKWVGLTVEEIDQLAIDAGIITWIKRVYDDVDKKFYDLPLGEGMDGDGISLKQFADLISTRLKELNT